jgi:hypothetical protein
MRRSGEATWLIWVFWCIHSRYLLPLGVKRSKHRFLGARKVGFRLALEGGGSDEEFSKAEQR